MCSALLKQSGSIPTSRISSTLNYGGFPSQPELGIRLARRLSLAGAAVSPMVASTIEQYATETESAGSTRNDKVGCFSTACIRGRGPVWRRCESAIRNAATAASIVVCASGKNGSYMNRGAEVRRLTEAAEKTPHALRFTKDGQPKHPLYIPYTVQPMEWIA